MLLCGGCCRLSVWDQREEIITKTPDSLYHLLHWFYGWARGGCGVSLIAHGEIEFWTTSFAAQSPVGQGEGDSGHWNVLALFPDPLLYRGPGVDGCSESRGAGGNARTSRRRANSF